MFKTLIWKLAIRSFSEHILGDIIWGEVYVNNLKSLLPVVALMGFVKMQISLYESDHRIQKIYYCAILKNKNWIPFFFTEMFMKIIKKD